MKMRCTSSLVALLLHSAHVDAQQHYDADNGLYRNSPRVADSEVSFWTLEDPKRGEIDLSLHDFSDTQLRRASQPNAQSTVTPTGTGPERPSYYQNDVRVPELLLLSRATYLQSIGT
jgi:hypothetical protein